MDHELQITIQLTIRLHQVDENLPLTQNNKQNISPSVQLKSKHPNMFLLSLFKKLPMDSDMRGCLGL